MSRVGKQTPPRALWCLIAALSLLAAPAHAQAPVQVPSKRAITGAPPLFQSQPDPEIPGRFVSFTPSNCALSFSAAMVRGLTWSGECSGGRMQGRGTVIGYDYEQQPVFVFEGYIERGLRNNGVMHEFARKDGVLIGWRTEVVGSVLRPHTEVPFLDLPRPFLLALADWSRQTDGKDLLASMGAVGQHQRAKADRQQQPQQESVQDLQRRQAREQVRAYEAAVAQAGASDRGTGTVIADPPSQPSSPSVGNTAVGRQLPNYPSQPERSASQPRAMGHIPQNCPGGKPGMSCGGVEGGNDSERLARENREREREYRLALKRHEEEVRRNQAARANAQRQREAEERRQLQAQLQAKAAERSNLETKIRNAIFGPGAIVQYIDSAGCQSVFTNTTSYWITVVWDYTVIIENAQGTRSEQSQAAFELPPGQTRTWPVWAVICGDKGATWRVPGGAVTRKDNLNNYPYHLQ